MIHLYQWPSDKKLPNAGFFCMKLESYLRLQKIEHKVVTVTSFGKSPKQTMPYIEDGGVLKSDSQLIIDDFEAQSSRALNSHLTDLQKAESHAFQMMIEHQLIPIIIYFRWFPDQGWEQFSRRMFYGAPALVRILIGGLLRSKKIKSMNSVGLSRFTPEELTLFATRDLQSLSSLLGSKKYFFNEEPSLLDIVCFTVVSNILMAGVEMPLISEIKKYQNLISHANHLMELIYQRKLIEAKTRVEK